MRIKLIKGELAKLLNITKATIRYYEDKKVVSASKGENGYNLYDWKDLEDISNVLFLKDLGLSIEDVKKYKEGKKDIKNLLEDKRYDNVYGLYSEISSCNQSFILLHKDYDGKKHSFENSKMLLPDTDNAIQNNLC